MSTTTHDHYIVRPGGGTRWSTQAECTICGSGRES